MATRIEELRRLEEECRREARLMRAKGLRTAAEQTERLAERFGWQIQGEQAQADLAAFAARVEE